VFLPLRRVGLDLPDAGNVVVQQRIEVGRRFPLVAVAVAALCRINPCADRQHRHRQRRPRRDTGIEDEKDHADPHHLQQRDDPLLDAVDQHALHVRHVLHHPCHDVARPPRIEPLEGEALDFFVKIRADVEDDLLLEHVVQQDAQCIQTLPGEEP
jgi:hypothetical protein